MITQPIRFHSQMTNPDSPIAFVNLALILNVSRDFYVSLNMYAFHGLSYKLFLVNKHLGCWLTVTPLQVSENVPLVFSASLAPLSSLSPCHLNVSQERTVLVIKIGKINLQ